MADPAVDWWISSRLTAEGEWTPFFRADADEAAAALCYFGSDVHLRLSTAAELRQQGIPFITGPLAWASSPFKFPWTLAPHDMPNNGGIGFPPVGPYRRRASRADPPRRSQTSV